MACRGGDSQGRHYSDDPAWAQTRLLVLRCTLWRLNKRVVFRFSLFQADVFKEEHRSQWGRGKEKGAGLHIDCYQGKNNAIAPFGENKKRISRPHQGRTEALPPLLWCLTTPGCCSSFTHWRKMICCCNIGEESPHDPGQGRRLCRVWCQVQDDR